jgi:putative Mn2+ efflux pump MntP
MAGAYTLYMVRLVLILLPLGLDTLGVSVSLGIRSTTEKNGEDRTRMTVPFWLRSALLFALAETTMPLVGLALGFVASTLISGIMSVVGALLLIGVGLWELVEEGREQYQKRKKRAKASFTVSHNKSTRENAAFAWKRQLLLALSVSLDELAIGFSFGAVTANLPKGERLSPLALCFYIGIQGLVMALLGIALGRTLRHRLKPVKEWSELLSSVLLIGLGIWFLRT